MWRRRDVIFVQVVFVYIVNVSCFSFFSSLSLFPCHSLPLSPPLPLIQTIGSLTNQQQSLSTWTFPKDFRAVSIFSFPSYSSFLITTFCLIYFLSSFFLFPFVFLHSHQEITFVCWNTSLREEERGWRQKRERERREKEGSLCLNWRSWMKMDVGSCCKFRDQTCINSFLSIPTNSLPVSNNDSPSFLTQSVFPSFSLSLTSPLFSSLIYFTISLPLFFFMSLSLLPLEQFREREREQNLCNFVSHSQSLKKEEKRSVCDCLLLRHNSYLIQEQRERERAQEAERERMIAKRGSCFSCSSLLSVKKKITCRKKRKKKKSVLLTTILFGTFVSSFRLTN